MTTIRVTIDDDDRQTRRVVDALAGLTRPSLVVEVRDAREDDEAQAFLERLVCCGRITPVVEMGGLLLTAPSAAEVLLAIRRVAPELVG
ncbi:MAG: hypothetical protein WD638_08075 [Nitriliruptoraceae bacterium]